MNGVTVLTETLHSNTVQAIITGVLLLLAAVFAASLAILMFQVDEPIGGILLGFIAISVLTFSIGLIAFGITDDTVTQEVTVDESVNMNEFLERYEIFDQNGKILTVEVLEQPNE